MKITDDDRAVLSRARKLKSLDMGIMPTGSGQWARFRKLARLGLIQRADDAVHEETGRYGAAFELTPAGEAA